MIQVHLDEIKVPANRFRREFDERKLRELEESIKRIGLLQLPVVERVADGKFTLRAGERRLRVLGALKRSGIPFSHGKEVFAGDLVPVVELSELTPLARLEVEVEENVVRADFTWQERTAALAALHQLRSKQNPQQTLVDTASEVLGKPARGGQATAVSDALIISKHLHNPDVAKAKDAKEALKVIRKQAELVHSARLAKTFDLSKTEHKLLKGDAEDVFKSLSDNSFDVICTDPPYGVGADNFGSMAATGHEYEDNKKKFESMLKWLPDELFRLAKPQAHLYLFCDQRRFAELETHLMLAGWQVFPTMLVWYKGGGMLPLPEHGPRRTYETILYAFKGQRKTLAVKGDCIIKIPAVKDLKHGAQKPVALYCDLLARSARAGDSVLDCFGGTGPVLVAANRLKLVATYIELKDAPFNIAKSRILTKDIDDGAEEEDELEGIDFGA